MQRHCSNSYSYMLVAKSKTHFYSAQEPLTGSVQPAQPKLNFMDLHSLYGELIKSVLPQPVTAESTATLIEL